MYFFSPYYLISPRYGNYAALPMVTLKLSLYTNVTFIFDFDFWLDQPVHGGSGRGSPTPKGKKVIDKQRN
jgi:hypothetical protein